MDDKYVLQYSYERRKIHPYEKTKIWYYGPKLDHMKEVKDDSKRKTKKIRTNTKPD